MNGLAPWLGVARAPFLLLPVTLVAAGAAAAAYEGPQPEVVGEGAIVRGRMVETVAPQDTQVFVRIQDLAGT